MLVGWVKPKAKPNAFRRFKHIDESKLYIARQFVARVNLL